MPSEFNKSNTAFYQRKLYYYLILKLPLNWNSVDLLNRFYHQNSSSFLIQVLVLFLYRGYCCSWQCPGDFQLRVKVLVVPQLCNHKENRQVERIMSKLFYLPNHTLKAFFLLSQEVLYVHKKGTKITIFHF